MNSYSEEEKLIHWYLLGAVSPEEEEHIEHRLQQETEYGELLLLVEEDLVDDYARGLLSEGERDLFEQNFLTTPERHQKLMLAQAAVKYVNALSVANAEPSVQPNELFKPDGTEQIPSVAQPKRPLQNARPGREWWRALFTPGWKIAAYAVLIAGIGLGAWQKFSSESDIAVATNAMNQVYRVRRPLEIRITGFDYAPFPKTLGDDQEKFDYRALDRAERILHDAVTENPTVENQHALGRLYLARKKFDQAETVFNAALQTDPNNAQLHSDLGAVLFEKWDRERSAGQTVETERLKRQSQEHLIRALTLDGALREARFNLALLYQASNQTQPARAEWEKYLVSELDSRGKAEAQRNLELLK